MKSKLATKMVMMSACLVAMPVLAQQPFYYQQGMVPQAGYATQAQFSTPPVGSTTRGAPLSVGATAPIPAPTPTPSGTFTPTTQSFGSSVAPSPGMPTTPQYGAPTYSSPTYSSPTYPAGPSTVPPTYSPPAYSEPAPAVVGEPWNAAAGCDSCDSATDCGDCNSCGSSSCACSCGGGLLGSLGLGGLGGLGGIGGIGGMPGGGLFGNNGPARPARIWGGLEYLYWWNKNRTVPVLATTSPVGTPQATAGVLGFPTTTELFGGEYDDDPEGGVRGTLGLWLDQNQTMGVFGRAFVLGAEEINFRRASDGDPILARPFFDADLNVNDSLLVAYPNVTQGTLTVNTENEITGFDLLARKMLYYGNCNRIDLIGGYHHTEITDSVRVGHSLVSVDPLGRVPVGTTVTTADIFRAENEFDGGSIGLMAQGYDGRLTWNLLTKISFGNTNERVTIQGSSTTTVPGAGSATIDQGLLALDTNTGVYERDEFTIVPELDLSVAYHLSTSLQVSVGYSVIYWSNAVMAGDAIDLAINPTQINGALIGPAAPTYSISDESFWAHGLTFGVNGRF